MHFIASLALLSSVVSPSRYSPAQGINLESLSYPATGVSTRPYYPTGTAGANFGSGTTGAHYGTGTGNAGAVATNSVYTTQIIVTDCGNGTMIYSPATSTVEAGNHWSNGTAATLIPAATTAQATPTLANPYVAAASSDSAESGSHAAGPTKGNAASGNAGPEAFTGGVSARSAPSMPVLSIVAGLALVVLCV